MTQMVPTASNSLREIGAICGQRIRLAIAALSAISAVNSVWAQHEIAAPLPSGVRAVWDPALAYRDTTPTRERICLNGLWRWQPATLDSSAVPTKNWGWFKVPGCWPGIQDYMQKDSQTLITHANWQNESLRSIAAAWYQREITLPADWAGRRITLAADYVNSVATVFVDGAKRGEIRFPGGELDLTDACPPGSTHLVSVHVAALPLKSVLLSYSDTNTAREVRGRVARRGLCGDVFLTSAPREARLADVKVETSVRRREITFDVAAENLALDRHYVIEARLTSGPVSFASQPFGAADLVSGRLRFTEHWMPDALWDLHTPQNTQTVRCTLREANGTVCDTQYDVRFGFREFWIEGRDFMLNGSRIALSAVPLDNAQIGATLASYAGARESLRRLKGIGINFVYTHNYGCEPGSHLGFEEILRAADDAGMLVAFSQPHFSHYDWKVADADQTNGYARHAAFYVHAAQNHPAVVAYAMSHNATGYGEDMNPDQIDGLRDPREGNRAQQANAALALRAEAIVKRFDPSRVIYHHSSGNLGSMHTINFYPNFVPPQEMSDWFEHWATVGVKPAFMCEYGAPFTWDWTMYRGWYKGEREFGGANVPWQFSLAEWNAQFVGDDAFRISGAEADNLRWEARQLAAGKVWHRWDYPHQVGSTEFDERYPIFALYLADNWPAYRTWGVSAISPWEYGHFWKLRPGVDRQRRALNVDWDHLQRPGFSPDFIGEQYERMDLAYEPEDWIATPAAQALVRYNAPLLAYIAGKPAAFTSKDHLFTPGETVEKQLIVINNSRERVTCDARWTLALPAAVRGKAQLRLAPGGQQRVPIHVALPADSPAGEYRLSLTARFSSGEVQTDEFPLQIVPRASTAANLPARIALFDPHGETTMLLARLGIRGEPINATTNLAPYDVLVVGKQALSMDGAAPDIDRVRDGLKVLLFEQTSDVLEKRFGFRVAEYGLRRVFPRVPNHPVLAGITGEQLRDWRGDATLLAPRLTYEQRPRYGPTVKWCDIPVTRLWRCGNRGNVASVLIEKPARSDCLAIVDGGFDLQYASLLECHEGRGALWFCQLDVSGRTEPEPTADRMTANLLRHVVSWTPPAMRRAVYAGAAEGRAFLARSGIIVDAFDGGAIERDRVVILAAGFDRSARWKSSLARFIAQGGRVVAVGLDQADVDALLPEKITFASREHIASFFPAPLRSSVFAGIGAADVMNRDPHKLSLVTGGAEILGDGILASTEEGRVVFCQLVPWQFDPVKQSNLKRTFRRAAVLLARVLANQGIASTSPLIERFHAPITANGKEQRWLDGLYLESPEEWDDPYRFFRW